MDRVYADFREPPTGEVRRIPLLETVWKIAGELHRRDLYVVHNLYRGSLPLIYRLAAHQFEDLFEFPDSLSRHFGE